MDSAAWGLPRSRVWTSALADVPFVAFDAETTGLHVSDRLVELAAVRFRGDAVEGEWSALVDPGVAIPREATAIHGIRDADVAGQEPAVAMLPAFLGFIDGAALVAHNAPFDVRVLTLELLRAGLPLPDSPVLDTCAIPRRLGVEVPNHRLSTLARTFGVAQQRAHRALDDARVAKELLRAYLRELGHPAEIVVRQSLTRDAALASFRGFASGPVPETPLLALVRRARAEGRALFLAVRDGGRPRRVTPRDVYSAWGTTYIEADCPEDGSVRTLRADAIAGARLA